MDAVPQRNEITRDLNSSPARACPSLRPVAPSGDAGPIPSDQLFAGHRKVSILHAGGVYQLQQTRMGKLILTK